MTPYVCIMFIIRRCCHLYKNTIIQVYSTKQGPSRGKDSTINDSMTYTVIKMNNSMIKTNQNHHFVLRLFLKLHLTFNKPEEIFSRLCQNPLVALKQSKILGNLPTSDITP